MADALRSKPKVTIARLGQIDGPQSAESAAINFMQVTEALIDVKAMEAIGKPPVTLSLIKKYAGLYRTGKRKAWLQENKLLMPTYGHTMFADMDSMFASIGGASHEFRNTNKVKAGKDASDLIMDGWNDAVATFVSSKFHTDGLVNRKAADTTISRLASLAAPVDFPSVAPRVKPSGGSG